MSAQEYEIKAAFLYNFAKFVEWPTESFPAPGAPIVIGVLGEDPFGEVLDRTVQGRQAQGRPIQIQRWRQLSETGPCHILFISASLRRLLPEILRKFQTQPVLTVSDENELGERGAVVQFLLRDSKVRFEINDRGAKTAGLRISSLLLMLALRVWE
ncbi:MAG TPA: YfiR family protein [Terriglobia bacterium]|nr:YfiR family protein [Terriglobia bacterium]